VTRVVKIGGRAQADARLATLIRDAWLASPGELCLVHGGGDEISAMQRAIGRESAFVGGRRVTAEGDLELLRMVLSGIVNKRLVNELVTVGVPAVGISGEDAALIRAEVIDFASLGYAGRPVGINVKVLRTLMSGGYLPVVSPVAYNATEGLGGTLNVNGDDAAAAIAAALGADELLLIADVEGVRSSAADLIPILHNDSVRELISNGTAGGGMAAKLESALAALASGVGLVRICDIDGLVEADRGTSIAQSQSVAT
jgi:acetylglutamate kinase